MPLLDWMPRSSLVDIGGRRYECRPPTLRSVLVCLSACREEIAAVARITANPEYSFSDDPVSDIAPLFAASAGIRAALDGTCRAVDGGPLPDDPAVLTHLICACLDHVDAVSLAATLDITASPSGGGGDDALSGFDLKLCSLAHRFGVTPFALMEWPYDAFVTASEWDNVMHRLEDRRSGLVVTDRASQHIDGADPDAVARAGIKVHRYKQAEA